MLFEKILIYLMRNNLQVTVTTGLVYGHKMIKMGRYEFCELSDDNVSITGTDFYTHCKTFEDAMRIISCLRFY